MIWIWLQGGEPGVRQGHPAHQAHRGGRVGAHQVPGDWRIFHCIWGKFPFSQLYFHKSPSGSRWLKKFSFVYAENFLFFLFDWAGIRAYEVLRSIFPLYVREISFLHRLGRVEAHQVPGNRRVFPPYMRKIYFSLVFWFFFIESPSGTRILKKFFSVYGEHFPFARLFFKKGAHQVPNDWRVFLLYMGEISYLIRLGYRIRAHQLSVKLKNFSN